MPCYGVKCALWYKETADCVLLAKVGVLEALQAELYEIRCSLNDLVKVVAAK